MGNYGLKLLLSGNTLAYLSRTSVRKIVFKTLTNNLKKLLQNRH